MYSEGTEALPRSERRKGRTAALFFMFLISVVSANAAVDLSAIPKPTGYVSDLANVLSPAEKQNLEIFCVKVEQQLGAQFAIVTVNTLGDQPIENFSNELFRAWGVGPKGKNEGLLILLAVKDRRQRIEVGRGLEQYVTDAIAGDTMRGMRVFLRRGDYGGGLLQGAQLLAGRIAQGKNVPFSEAAPLPRRARRDDGGGGIPFVVIVFIILFILLFFLSRRGGGGRGRGAGTGFWTGVLLNSMLNSGRGGGNWGSGNWGSGGFGGGSDGGGGFGGFGGGDSGGGGASSDW